MASYTFLSSFCNDSKVLGRGVCGSYILDAEFSVVSGLGVEVGVGFGVIVGFANSSAYA